MFVESKRRVYLNLPRGVLRKLSLCEVLRVAVNEAIKYSQLVFL
ncbi:hypothetical protein HMPREF0208_00487 [Citrobacter koseri]|nr:hypothetical protein HMPREF0208_00487 [Citrobacter koseri]